MIFRTIRCSECGHTGPRKIAGAGPVEPSMDLFTDHGHDPWSGKLYFRCPECETLVAVDPVEALGEREDLMIGCPSSIPKNSARPAASKSILPVLSGVYTLLVLFILLTKISV